MIKVINDLVEMEGEVSPNVQSSLITHNKNGTTPPTPGYPINENNTNGQQDRTQNRHKLAQLMGRILWMVLDSDFLLKKKLH